MIDRVEIQQGNRTVTAYQLTLFAFTTEKGTFTLSGSNADGTDEWREVGTSKFHKWNRSQIYNWFIQGKIKPVDEAKSIDWYNNTDNKVKRR